MTMLILGVLLWSVVHFFPVFMPATRATLFEKIGEGPYKGLFSLLIFGSIALMVFGWRSVGSGAEWLTASYGLRHVTYLLILVSIVLFGASQSQSRIRLLIRHPMLAGVAVWAIGHLLVNSDPRSLVLFGGLLVWAEISIIGINRRDGAYERPDPWGWGRELRLLLISVMLYVELIFAHPYFTGVPLF